MTCAALPFEVIVYRTCPPSSFCQSLFCSAAKGSSVCRVVFISVVLVLLRSVRPISAIARSHGLGSVGQKRPQLHQKAYHGPSLARFLSQS